MSKVLIVDPAKCRGCQSCMIACATKHGGGESNLKASRIQVTTYPDGPYWVPQACIQCEKPYCALVCPTTALVKSTETGVVQRSKDKCVGCKLCLVGCPFGNVSFSNGISQKCDTCEGDPCCVKVCAWNALSYGEADQIGEGKRAYFANKVYETQKDSQAIA